ncbi:hypothetical protein ACOMHN_059067 [Nucella lapillus]
MVHQPLQWSVVCAIVHQPLQWSVVCAIVHQPLQWSVVCAMVHQPLQWSVVCAMVNQPLQWSVPWSTSLYSGLQGLCHGPPASTLVCRVCAMVHQPLHWSAGSVPWSTSLYTGLQGELHVPLEVCGAVVKRELDFWQIDEMEIKACCWRHYRSYIENQAILDSFNNSLLKENVRVDLDSLKGWEKLQWQVWLILEHPRTSRPAMTTNNRCTWQTDRSLADKTMSTEQRQRTESGTGALHAEVTGANTQDV